MAVQAKTAELPWKELSADEKMDKRIEAWLSPDDITFISAQAESDYKARVSRIADAIRMKKNPDRVPVSPFLGEYAAAYCGYTQKDVMYDVDKAIDVATRCTIEFDFDAKTPAAAPTGRVYEILDERQRKWPGHGVADDGSPQFIEGEYMTAEQYDDFILDEADFRWRSYLPKTWGAMEGMSKLMSLGSLNAASVSAFGLPEVQESLKKLMAAGEEAQRWVGKIAATNKKLTELGWPNFRGSVIGLAPFDLLGDNLRGQRGIALDMYKRPEKLLAAIDVITEKKLHQIRQTGENGNVGGSPIVGFPLHKGADGFMSDEQFRTFYWPSLKKICLALIEEGYVPELRTQGGYESRLEVIRDMPRGKILCHLYLTDIEPAKKALGETMCVVGSVPQSLLSVGTIKEVEDYSKRLVDIGAPGGGFMMTSPGALGSDSNADNIMTMIKTAKEYGKY